MTTNNQPALQPPDRIWIQPNESNLMGVGPIWFTRRTSMNDVEYTRVNRTDNAGLFGLRLIAESLRREQEHCSSLSSDRLIEIQNRYSSDTANERGNYDVRANDLAWLIQEVELSRARVRDGGQFVDREVAAKLAFDTVKAALESDNHYSPLQVAAMTAANVRQLGG